LFDKGLFISIIQLILLNIL